MRYLPLLLMLGIIISCAEKGSEQSQAAELQEQNEPKTLEKSESKYSGLVEENHPTANFPEFAKNTIDSLPDSILIDVDNVIYGDFNADAKEDFSSKFTNLENGKQGIIIIHNTDQQDYHVFGGGQVINGMDNLDWIDILKPIPKGQAVAATLVDPKTGDIIGHDEKNAVTLKGNGIYMHIDEAGGGGIIYWDGSKYNWLHIE